MSDNIHIVQLSAYTNPIIKESKRDEWVEFGEDNNYFQFLVDRYVNSTTNGAIINSISRLIYGRGLSAVDASRKPNEYAQMMALFNPDCLRKIAMDRKMLGQFAFQVHYNDKHDKILKAYHMPVNLLRTEKCNADGEIEGYYYSDDWTDTKKFKPKRFSAFGTSKDKVEVLFSMPYSVGMKYYAYPDYQASLPYSVLEEEVGDYLINEVQNGFSGRTVVNFNNGTPSPEQQSIITNKVKSILTGSKGQKVIVAFNDNKEAATTVESLPLADAPDHYTYLSEECVRKIMLGHSVTSPLIFGIANASGFSSNADELENSFILFNNMVIKPIQDEILESLDKILAFNDISLNLFFKTLKPLEFTDLENAQSTDQVAEETGTNLSAQSELDTILAMVDENQLGAEWSEVDARDAGDNDEELDIALMEAESSLEPKQSLLSKVYNFVQTGSPKEKQKSAQDRKVGELKYFKVRYRYTGNKTPDREFCTAMMAKQDRLFRKEDIDEMSGRRVNAGFGENGANTYDIFKFKGGARCHHKWERVTFMLDLNKIEDGYDKIGTRAAEVKGYKVTNPYEVSIYPNNLPLKGFSPNNRNLPSDAK
tara:strand:+ start:11704 stop:13485 length:1782 start_codon:yes stop_codon:yes gene_type:complete